MTAEERADWERREAIRAARFEAFVQRQLTVQRAMERAAQKACELDLAERRRQLVLDFAI